jgi:hypothetical protein
MATTSSEAQRQIIGQLQITCSKGNDLRVGLLLADKGPEAESVQKKNRVLEREIDRLIARLLDQWGVDAGSVIEDGRKRNRNLQGMIRDIENQIDVAKKVIKAVGLIDDAIATAKKILLKLA